MRNARDRITQHATLSKDDQEKLTYPIFDVVGAVLAASLYEEGD